MYSATFWRRFKWRADYEGHHPATAILVVEIADTTLAFDRRTKASLYAWAGIHEYWIVNLPDNVLEVHRDPGLMADQPFGHCASFLG
jgi:Uma2 family endonuclease